MKNIKTVVLMIAICLAAFASLMIVSANSSVTANAGDDDAVLKVLLLEAESIEKGDMDTLNKIWSHDDSVLIFESGGMDKGWKNYRDHHLAPELKAFQNTKFSVSDAKVKVEGNTAWATYKYSLAADYKDQKVDTGGLGTMVFEKSNDVWLIVHSHTSATRKKAN